MAGGGIIEIDASEVADLIAQMSMVLTPVKFNQTMYSIFKRSTGKIRKFVAADSIHHYHVTSGEVKKAIKNPKITSGVMGGVGCNIPITDSRKKLGNGRKKTFPAQGGARGWQISKGKYPVTASIVKGRTSTLPGTIPSIGWKPFRNYTAPKLNGLVFARTSSNAFAPIKPVTSIAVPQMPMNLARREVEADIEKYFAERVYHEYTRIMNSLG